MMRCGQEGVGVGNKGKGAWVGGSGRMGLGEHGCLVPVRGGRGAGEKLEQVMVACGGLGKWMLYKRMGAGRLRGPATGRPPRRLFGLYSLHNTCGFGTVPPYLPYRGNALCVHLPHRRSSPRTFLRRRSWGLSPCLRTWTATTAAASA